MDKISIIVPAYNIDNYIEASVRSIQAQTYQNIEIILVDDGSSDSTPQILDQLAGADERIKVIHQPNGGVTNARLRGVAEATGQWIGFVDGDDYIEPNMFELLLNNAQTYGADISHCGYQMVFPNRVDLYYGTGKRYKQDRKAALKDLLAGGFEPGLWNKLFRRSICQKAFQKKEIDTSIRNNEDLLMNYYLFCEATTSVFEDVCPYHYLVRKGSAANSGISRNALEDPARVREILCEETKDDLELHGICLSSLAGQWIRMATMPTRENRELLVPIRDSARMNLRSLLPEIRRNPNCGTRIRTLVTWASLSPTSYQIIHYIHSQITGNARKYDIE